MKAIVTTYRTGGDRIALAAVRALARTGWQVTLASDDLTTPAFRSRHVTARLQVPSPITDPTGHARALVQAARDSGIRVILPTDDYAVLALVHARAELGDQLRAPLPPAGALDLTHDKTATLELAARTGLAIPPSFPVDTAAAAQMRAAGTGFPVVLKLARGNGAVGLKIAHEPSDIDRYFDDRAREHADNPHRDGVFDFSQVVLQGYVGSETHDFSALCDRGRVLAAVTTRRALTFPHDGGIGILVETTRDPALEAAGARLLEALNWHGPAQVEFRRAPDGTGAPFLIEVNGRFWGSLAASVAAGVNFPDMACRLALGQPIGPAPQVRVGLRYRYPLPFLFEYARSGAPWRDIWQLAQAFLGARSDLRLSDPAPALAQIRQALAAGQDATNLSPLAATADHPPD